MKVMKMVEQEVSSVFWWIEIFRKDRVPCNRNARDMQRSNFRQLTSKYDLCHERKEKGNIKKEGSGGL